jgi:cytochrome c oxidase cbb3-type subunit 1
MEWFIKAFIRSSLLWFAAGIALGIAMSIHPPWVIYRPAHAHMTVVGFLTMLVFGVGYQLLPRLFGHPLYSAWLAKAHLLLANFGLVGLVVGFLVRPHRSNVGVLLTSGGGLVFGIGVAFWVWNLWRTFDAADARQRARVAAGKPELPTIRE